MAGSKKGKGSKSDQDDLAQFNYRQPGEPETIGTESKENPEADEKAVADKINKEQEQRDHQREGALKSAEGGEGLSPNKGMSDPKTQKEVDDENTWGSGR